MVDVWHEGDVRYERVLNRHDDTMGVALCILACLQAVAAYCPAFLALRIPVLLALPASMPGAAGYLDC